MKLAFVLLLAACSSPTQQSNDVDAGGDSGTTTMADAAIVSATCEGRTAQPLDASWTIMVGGASRVARVHVPASYDPSKRTPVVINIHGRTQNASQQASLSHAVAKSNSAGFILIHPEAAGSPTSWNAGTCCDPAKSANTDDSGFIRKLIEEAEAKLCVDPDRVFATGMSNGAYLSHRVACELSDKIAAIGPVAGLLLMQTCSPTRPVPVFFVNGTADQLSTYQYVDEGVDFWRAKNNCTTMQTTYQQGDATCVTHGGCTDGADVVLCTIADGGHQWPGGETLPFMGQMSNDLIATDAIWNFFVAHPK